MSLEVLPQARLTVNGLADVDAGELVPLFVSKAQPARRRARRAGHGLISLG